MPARPQSLFRYKMDKAFHVAAVIYTLLIIAKIEAIQILEEFKDDFASSVGIRYGHIQFFFCPLQCGVVNRFSVELVITQLATQLSQDLPAQVLRHLPMFVHFAQSCGYILQFAFQQQVDLSLQCICGYQVIDLGNGMLPIAMDASNTLLQIHWIPRQIVVEEHLCKLQIDAFSTSSGADKCLGTVWTFEAFLCRRLCCMVAALEHLYTFVREI